MSNIIPEVIMVGMSRAGTSFMYHNLQKHPQIFVPSRKEVCYFAHNFGKKKSGMKVFLKKKKKMKLL